MYNQLENVLYNGTLNLSRPDGPPRKCSRLVPKILHFIWVGSAITQTHARRVVTFATMNPQWKVMLWVDRPLENCTANTQELIEEASIRPAGGIIFKSIQAEKHRFRNWDIIRGVKNFGFQSDWLRLEIGYLYGGIYVDTDAVALHSFDDYGTLFRWPWVTHIFGGYNNICNCAFGMDEKSGFLDFALNASRDNCLKYKMWKNGIETVGSTMLTVALKRYNQSDISMIPQDFMLHNTTKAVMFESFEASWQGQPIEQDPCRPSVAKLSSLMASDGQYLTAREVMAKSFAKVPSLKVS